MKNIENIGRELELSGKADKIKKLALSEDGKKLSAMFDAGAAAKAAENGDTDAMKNIVKDVLKSEEGKRLAEQLLKLMGG